MKLQKARNILLAYRPIYSQSPKRYIKHLQLYIQDEGKCAHPVPFR